MNNHKAIKNSIKLLNEVCKDKINKRMIFITTKTDKEKIFTDLKENLRKIIPNSNIDITDNKFKLIDNINNFVLIETSQTKRKEFTKLMDELRLLKINIEGIIILPKRSLIS